MICIHFGPLGGWSRIDGKIILSERSMTQIHLGFLLKFLSVEVHQEKSPMTDDRVRRIGKEFGSAKINL
jgi:hypothetical protein